MRKSLLVLLCVAQAAAAHAPPTLDDPARQAIQRFLSLNRILDTPQELDGAPYIVAAAGGRVLGTDGQPVYARGVLDPAQPVYGIFRQGKVYTDPHTQELLGINADDIGTARFVTAGDLTTLKAARITQEIRPGDRLLKASAATDVANLVIEPPAQIITGRIIDVPRGVTHIGVLDAVTLDKGRRDGLLEGHLLNVMSAGETVQDRVADSLASLPDEHAGTLLVFRTYEKLSYALVISASRSLAVMDRFTTPDPSR